MTMTDNAPKVFEIEFLIKPGWKIDFFAVAFFLESHLDFVG